MQTIVLTQEQRTVDVRGTRFVHVPTVYAESFFQVGCCGSRACGAMPGSSEARVCTRTDCGLADRHARSDAA